MSSILATEISEKAYKKGHITYYERAALANLIDQELLKLREAMDKPRTSKSFKEVIKSLETNNKG